jgi:predicted NACHT family NTPase
LYHVAGVRWLGGDNLGEEFLEAIQEDEVVDDILHQINNVVHGKMP